MPPTSLLIAILVMLRYPSARNQATAALLLARVTQHAALSPAERETCQCLLDELEQEVPSTARAQAASR